MIGTVTSVIRGEGWASAARRTGERISDALRDGSLLARGVIASTSHVPILNAAPDGIATRLGGVQAQLVARLRCERTLRPVALLRPGILELPAHARRVRGIREALTVAGARTVHVEGTSGADIAELLRLIDDGIDVFVSVHDVSLLAEPLAPQLLAGAKRLIFPSDFLLETYRRRFGLASAEVIEPGVPPSNRRTAGRGVAFAGSVKEHKGAHLLPQIAHGTALHVFGGGDEALFRDLRGHPNLILHGYYRAGRLPSLLARHGVGLVVLPSIVEESFSLVLSEAWQTGAAVAAFDRGAPAERIRAHGGGWVAQDADGLAGIVRRWGRGELETTVPRDVPLAMDAARAHVALYGLT